MLVIITDHLSPWDGVSERVHESNWVLLVRKETTKDEPERVGGVQA